MELDMFQQSQKLILGINQSCLLCMKLVHLSLRLLQILAHLYNLQQGWQAEKQLPLSFRKRVTRNTEVFGE